MNIAGVQSGSSIAPECSVGFVERTSPPSSLAELLTILDGAPPKSLPMLRSTSSKIAEYYGESLDKITLDQVIAMRGQFRRFLERQKYAENSIRSYVNYVRVLIQMARGFGWRPWQALPQEWQGVLARASKWKCTDLIRHLALIKKTPRDITVDDVDKWGEVCLKQGTSSILIRRKKGAFWHLLHECGMSEYTPVSMIQARGYGTPWEELPESIRSEAQALMKWKTADFSFDRPKGGQIRSVTADKIREKICHLFGFATKIRGVSEISSLSQLVSKEIVSDYVAWCINERSVKGETLHSHLGRLDVAMRQHPSYKSLDLAWFKTLLESLPVEPPSERRMRKERKFLDYSAVDAIPAKIHRHRLSVSSDNPVRVAGLAMEELLIKWLTVLPWRQRNIRECRVGGQSPNLFKASIPNHIPIDRPPWVQTEAHVNPEASFWQLHFLPKETKTGREIRTFLPRPLIKPLEEYLAEFRPLLVGDSDPGTLFIQKDGKAMKSSAVYSLVTRLTSRYGGRAVNPHLFRDIVAFAWLKAHPKDYLTLSKILWHANINVTIKTYGSRFDESSGVCAMEAWIEELEAGSK